VRSRLLPFATVLAAACAIGCEKEDAPLVGAAIAADALAPSPRDHFGPGELLEGNERAFGLALPRGTHIDSAFPQQVLASTDAKATDVANYIRTRVSMGTVKVGAASTMFDRVQVPALPSHELVIRVEEGPMGNGSRITLRDVTPPPVDPGLSDEERWRQAGLKGPGQAADPTHLH
jgi:hypothetical protein